MRIENDTIVWNLREISEKLIEWLPVIELYLFGSRGYQTNSLRSDIDVLAVIPEDQSIHTAELNRLIHDSFPPVDLFYTYDGKRASSIANGSSIIFRANGYRDLPEQLDAIKLWSKNDGFSDHVPWEQKALRDISFAMSIVPSSNDNNPSQKIEYALEQLEKSGIRTFFAGSSIFDISKTILQMIKKGFSKPKTFQKKAKNFSFDTIKLQNEYDFQNYIHMLLRPVFSDIEPEPVMVKIDGNNKKADFGLHNNQIIIETKWIDSTSKKEEVLKTLHGLQNFYKENPMIQSLLFMVLYSKNVELDEVILQARFEKELSGCPTFIRFFKNVYES